MYVSLASAYQTPPDELVWKQPSEPSQSTVGETRYA
jgi:hypothetical protein